MRSSNIVLLVIVLLVVVLGVAFFVNDVSKESKKKVIDPNKYDKNVDGLIGKEICGGGDVQCQREFNSYWYCSDVLDKCLCAVNERLSPVCGVDGKDYSNPSEANCAGVEVAYGGVCGSEGKICIKCGDSCISVNPNEIPGCGQLEGFECKVINRECTKVSSGGSFCGNGVCEDVVCLAIGCPLAETPSNCPQDCKSGDTCIDLRNKINIELQKVIACSSDDECTDENIDGFAGNSAVFCCGKIYNKNADLSTLISLDKEYGKGQGEISCLRVACTCLDPTGAQVKCVNNKCGLVYL